VASTFAVLTFGCRANEADSCGFEERLLAAGVVRAPAETAELVIVNTCSVTAAADQAARQAVRRVARLNPGARIVATGCYATRRPDDVAVLPGVVRLVPNGRKHEIAGGSADVPFPGMRGRTTYPLKIQTGCDAACSYCIVPTTRGSSRSTPPGEVLQAARRLAAAGFLEIVLTGIHLGAWGRDLSPALSLAGLLDALEALPGATRFRLSSLEPMDCSEAVIETIAGSTRFQPHFHLPLQHASDRILGAMRRPYTAATYRQTLERIRTRLPDAAIGSDVIAGFPGERDDDAAALEAFLAASPITYLHVFPFSARPGTEAVALRPRVAATVVRERAGRLRALGRTLAGRFAAAQVGRTLDGLTLRDGSVVLTDNFLKVRVPPGRRRNERVKVRVTSATPLQGEVLP